MLDELYRVTDLRDRRLSPLQAHPATVVVVVDESGAVLENEPARRTTR